MAQTELHLQCGEWAPCQTQQDSCCTFIPHHFFREQQWEHSSSLWLFTALYVHLPALTGLPHISILFIFPAGRAHRSFWAGHSSIPCCFGGCIAAAGHGAGQLPMALQNPLQAAKYQRSSMLPAHSPTTAHRRELKASLGISLQDWTLLAFRTHPPHIRERTGLDQEALAVPTMKLSFSVVSAASLALEAPKSCPIPRCFCWLLPLFPTL